MYFGALQEMPVLNFNLKSRRLFSTVDGVPDLHKQETPEATGSEQGMEEKKKEKKKEKKSERRPEH